MPDPVADAWAFCERILVDVSRSFALIIPECPPPIDRALCVGYLLCRIADTVEDEEHLTPPQRETLYDGLLRAIDATSTSATTAASVTKGAATDRTLDFVHAWPLRPEGSYGHLIEGTHHVLIAYADLPAWCRPPLAQCVHDMIAGMRSMHPLETRHELSFYCGDLAGLDQYCHHVAGTVGIMSTALFEHHLGPRFNATPAWREQGRRMGLGLQMTNIIKDACVDALRGVSYIPARFVDFTGNTARLSATGRSTLITHTIAHLDEAIAYILAIPRDEQGLRTFLLGSVLPAIATLNVAARTDQLAPKIDRAEMLDLLAFIANHVADDDAIKTHYMKRRNETLALSTASG